LSTFALQVFGCQMNVYDADRLRTALVDRGLSEADPDSADLVLFVTCSIRAKAEQKVASELGRLAIRHARTGRPWVGVAGCMAQRLGASLAERFANVRIVAGPRSLGLLPEAAEGVLRDGRRRLLLDADPRALEDLEELPRERLHRHKAYLTIAHGCDRFCSYCIVPYVRGRFRSRPEEEILAEAETLVAEGARELTLLGQNVDAWGGDLPQGRRFADLLDRVSRIPGLVRLRFTTSHPADFDARIVAVMADRPNVCPAVNLPVQSGSDRVLAEMRRGYTLADYEERVARIRSLGEVGLTTDLIVGFPGETEEDFRASAALLERIRFDAVHTASFSPREGTAAARRDDFVPDPVKAARLNEINALQLEIAREINRALHGRTYPVLVDGPAPRGGGWSARTPQDKVVILPDVPGDGLRPGSLLTVRIVGSDAWSLRGEPLSPDPGAPAAGG
jgi:tRNA-2-methylthio-N6-dimethylallyladenosine synthase